MNTFKGNAAPLRGDVRHLPVMLFLTTVMMTATVATTAATVDPTATWTLNSNLVGPNGEKFSDPLFVRMTPFGNVQCASKNGRDCLWGVTDSRKLPSENQMQPLMCGQIHKNLYGITGYDTRGHWCQTSQLAFIVMRLKTQWGDGQTTFVSTLSNSPTIIGFGDATQITKNRISAKLAGAMMAGAPSWNGSVMNLAAISHGVRATLAMFDGTNTKYVTLDITNNANGQMTAVQVGAGYNLGNTQDSATFANMAPAGAAGYGVVQLVVSR